MKSELQTIIEKRLIEACKSLDTAMNQVKVGYPTSQDKNLSDWDLESFRIFKIHTEKSWFKKKTVLMYHQQGKFTIEVITHSWFSLEEFKYDNLDWLEALQLYRDNIK